MKQGEVNCFDIFVYGVGILIIFVVVKGVNVLMLIVMDKQGNDFFMWSYKLDDVVGL